MQNKSVILGVALGLILHITPGWSRGDGLTQKQREEAFRAQQAERDRQPLVPPTPGTRNRDGKRREQEPSKQQEKGQSERAQSDKKEEQGASKR